MECGCGDGHDVVAVVEHEGVFVGMAEVIVGFDGTAGAGVDLVDVIAGGVEPD